MAYAAAITYTQRRIAGRRVVLVEISETEGAAGSEWTAALGDGLPEGMWTLVRVVMVRTAGSATTVAPVWGRATGPASGTAAYVGGLAAAGSQDSTNSGNGWAGDGATLYGRSVPDAGADNSITTRLYFVEGWDV